MNFLTKVNIHFSSNLGYKRFILYKIFNINFINSFGFKSFIEVNMENSNSMKREHEEDNSQVEPEVKSIKTPIDESNTRFSNLRHGKGRPLPKGVASKFTEDDAKLMEEVKTSCDDLKKICDAIQLRIKHRLSIRLPEDYDDSTYYIENGLRKVYPYSYIYQSYVKRRWIGRKLKDVLKEEFRDISDVELKKRFDNQRIIVNGQLADYEHRLKDNDFISNRTHRHELAVLATPIDIIYRDKHTLVVNKPPSIPIHPCGRYRHNSVLNILRKEYDLPEMKVVHRLDRLVSGVLILAFNSQKAHEFEVSIQNREIQKEYVCRVVGEFPIGLPENDGEITVDQPLENIRNKIGIAVCLAGGKPSLTKFKRLNYNGKTSTVLCKPKTGRMHQIRVHLQYLGHPIVNDTLYNCDSFGPERGKNGNFGGKSLKQLSDDIVNKHRSDVWLMAETSDFIENPCDFVDEEDKRQEIDKIKLSSSKTAEFISEEEKKETMAALEHFYTNESWVVLQKKYKFDLTKMNEDKNCRDCQTKYYDPPRRSLFLYLHAYKYSGPGWSYESKLPDWAQDGWKY